MKLRVALIVLSLFVSLLINQSVVQADSTDSLTYSQLNESTGEWTNMTLEGMAFYISSDIVEHNNSVYDLLQGNLIMDP